MADHPQPPTAGPGAGDPERRLEERREQDRRRLRAAQRRSTVALGAALLALLLVGALAWRDVRHARELQSAVAREQHGTALAVEDADRIARAIAALDERSARSAQALTELSTLRTQQAEMARSVAALEGRLAAPQRAVARAEAAALVVLGQRRLELERDVSGTILLYEAADHALEPFKDESVNVARAQLARDLAALRSVRTPDVRTVTIRLARAEESIEHLALLGTIREQYTRAGVAPAPGPGLARAWQQFTTHLNQLVSIRRVSDTALELISAEEADVRRHHMEALLFAARLAALRGDSPEYVVDLGAAGRWLHRFFDPSDPKFAQLAAELDELAVVSIAPPLPDVSGSVRLLQAKAP